MEQKFGQTQMAAVWKECTRMENAGKRKWVCSLFFVFLLLMGISFTALAAPQAGLNKTKLTMIKGRRSSWYCPETFPEKSHGRVQKSQL
ncbi:MAG: hypothetical protein ACLTSZ_03930 [Lachnospiraceae bacterium]